MCHGLCIHVYIHKYIYIYYILHIDHIGNQRATETVWKPNRAASQSPKAQPPADPAEEADGEPMTGDRVASIHSSTSTEAK